MLVSQCAETIKPVHMYIITSGRNSHQDEIKGKLEIAVKNTNETVIWFVLTALNYLEEPCETFGLFVFFPRIKFGLV